MKKQDKLNELSTKIGDLRTKLSLYENEYNDILIKKPITFKDFVVEFENEKSNILKVVYRKGKYTYILGGDGRSMPYDEEREGNILEIFLTDDFLIENDVFIKVSEYIKATYDKPINDIKIFVKRI